MSPSTAGCSGSVGGPHERLNASADRSTQHRPRDTVSTVTDAVLDEVKASQTRPLDEVYPIIYVDGLW